MLLLFAMLEQISLRRMKGVDLVINWWISVFNIHEFRPILITPADDAQIGGHFTVS